MLVAVAALLVGCGDGDESADVPVNGDAGPVVDTESPRDLARVVEQMMPALERISGLDRVETLRVRRQSREGARAYVMARLDEEMPPAEREIVRRTYVALGLLPDTLDLEALLLDLYTEQVLGYYDPSSRSLFVVSSESVDDLQPVIAHELVHALQDQHTNLDSLIAGERGNDRQTAAHAAMEGHAMLVMFTLLAEQSTGTAIDPAAMPNPAPELGAAMETQNSEFPVFRRAPAVIRETVLFPYLRGADFVHRLWSARRPLDRYPAPIDSLMPQSTEQIMGADEHFIQRRDEPVAVALGMIPEGWRLERENDLGMLETAIYLGQHLGESGRSAAEGWGGDRYALLVSPSGDDVILWRSVWDTPEAATRFAGAVRRAGGRRPDRQLRVEIERSDGRAGVRVIDAPAGVDTGALTVGR
jgi:hypothetical protein